MPSPAESGRPGESGSNSQSCDTVLQVVADRLVGSARAHDVVARVGGDEFMVVAGSLRDRGAALELGTRLLGAVNNGLGDHSDVSVHVSLGIATTDDPATRLDEVIASADRAMYEAKAAGGGRLRLASSPAMQTDRVGATKTSAPQRQGHRGHEHEVTLDLRDHP
jgi:predicted signal transduction protein with EAL and GGDEF domain